MAKHTMDVGPRVQQNSKTIAKATAVVVLRFQNCRMAEEEDDLPAMPLAACACGAETSCLKWLAPERFSPEGRKTPRTQIGCRKREAIRYATKMQVAKLKGKSSGVRRLGT